MEQQPPPTQKIALGIDLGTTFSVCSVYNSQTKKQTPITDDSGSSIIPSVVYFSDEIVQVGKEAQITVTGKLKRNPTTKQTTYIRDAKRIIGRTWENESLAKFQPQWDFNIEKGTKQGENSHCVDICVPRGNKVERLQAYEISALVLRHVVEISKKILGSKIIVKDVVVTVPAYFTNIERNATIGAARIAGLNVLRIINEPTAASIPYALDLIGNQVQHYLIFDLGGGTFDVSIVKITVLDGYTTVEVLFTDGDAALGGRDFERNLGKFVVEKYKEMKGEDMPSKMQRKLEMKLEAYKRKLSVSRDLLIDINKWEYKLSRETFNLINKEEFEKCTTILKRALSKVSADKIDKVILVGGSTYIPAVQDLVRKVTGKEPEKELSPELVVAYGAAIYANAIINNDNTLTVLDVNSHDIGVELLGKDMSVLIKRNTGLPYETTGTYSTEKPFQPAICVKIFEGNDPLTANNECLQEAVLNGFTPSPNLVPFDFTFRITNEGMIKLNIVCNTQPHWKRDMKAQSSAMRGSISDDDLQKFQDRHLSFLSNSTNTANSTNSTNPANATNSTNPTNSTNSTNPTTTERLAKLRKVLDKANTIELPNKNVLDSFNLWLKEHSDETKCSASEVDEQIKGVLDASSSFRNILQKTLDE